MLRAIGFLVVVGGIGLGVAYSMGWVNVRADVKATHIGQKQLNESVDQAQVILEQLKVKVKEEVKEQVK